MTKRELATQVEHLRALLRRVQWRADTYHCVGCRQAHNFGCRPGCEVTALLDEPTAKSADLAGTTPTTPRKSIRRPSR